MNSDDQKQVSCGICDKKFQIQANLEKHVKYTLMLATPVHPVGKSFMMKFPWEPTSIYTMGLILTIAVTVGKTSSTFQICKSIKEFTQELSHISENFAKDSFLTVVL